MSNIEWTQETWNPVVGCTRVSAGCDNCYAVGMTHRLGAMAEKDIREKGPGGAGKKANYIGLTVLNKRGARHFNGVVRCVEEALDIPLRWKKPRTIFVNSMGDLFHPEVPFEFIDRVFAVMALTPQHTYQILTKRPERMAEYLSVMGNGSQEYRDRWDVARRWLHDHLKRAEWGNHLDNLHQAERAGIFLGWQAWPFPNIWLGTSCEDQAAADARIPHLLRTPAAVRFLSCEPLLGGVNLDRWLYPLVEGASGQPEVIVRPRIDWVIVGGESGSDRFVPIEAFRSLRDQCRDAGVAYFQKQLGRTVEMSFDEWNRLTRGGADGSDDFTLLFEGADRGYWRPRNKKGGDMSEWPEDLRIREMPGGGAR